MQFAVEKDVVHGHIVETLRHGTGRVFETRLQALSGPVLDVELSVSFNNILTGVVGNLSLARLDVDPESQLYSRLAAAEKACGRAEEILRRLLTFADGGAPQRRSLKADRFIVEHLVPALNALNVPVSVNVSKDLPEILVDANLLAQALAELGAEAFVLKGAARIHVEGRFEGERHIACPTALASGQKVCLVLTAPDLRLSPLELDRIFEPYAFRHSAVALYQSALAKGKPFDAVILDLTVRGGLGAVEVVSELRRLDSKVKAFVASGYTLDPVMIDPGRYGFCGAAPKPFQYDALEAHLRQVIFSPPS